MIFVWKKHHILKLLFDRHCKTFNLCTRWQPPFITIFIHLLNYFLLLLQLTTASFCFYSTWTEQVSAIVTVAPWSSLRSKSTRYYPSRVIFLRFSVTTQITAAKQTRLVIHSFKRKGRMLYMVPWNYWPVLARLRAVTSLAKPEKTVKCTGQKESEKPPSLLAETENQRLNSRKPANRGRPKNRKTAAFKCKNRKTEPNISEICKTENPNAPLRKHYTIQTQITRQRLSR